MPRSFYLEFELLTGMLLRDWVRLLKSGVTIDFPIRGSKLLLHSLLNEALHWSEEREFGEAIAAQAVGPPLIVLGLARSGTTYLYTLLGQDTEFISPTPLQAYNPHTFFALGGAKGSPVSRILRALSVQWLIRAVARKVERPFSDLVGAERLEGPEEDEWALAASGLSDQLSTVFPRNQQLFERYTCSDRMDTAAQEKWKRTWFHFLKKLTLFSPGKRLLLKSVSHMARLPLILDLFPKAQFVFISRQPEDIVRSHTPLSTQMLNTYALQNVSPYLSADQILEASIEKGQKMLDAYLRHRDKLPDGQLVEIRYQDLVEKPEKTLEETYSRLGIANFSNRQRALRARLETPSTRQRPRYRSDTWWIPKLSEAWREYYLGFGYEPEQDRRAQ